MSRDVEHDSEVGRKLYKLLSADWPEKDDIKALLWRWAACFGPCTSCRKDRLVLALIAAAERIEYLEAGAERWALDYAALEARETVCPTLGLSLIRTDEEVEADYKQRRGGRGRPPKRFTDDKET